MKQLRALLAAAVLVLLAAPAGAVVNSPTRTVTYTGSGSTGPFTVTFHFVRPEHLVVTKVTIATGATTTLTQNVDYTVRMPSGTSRGTVTTTVAVAATHRLVITRYVPYTQPTSFTSAGSYNARAHEDALDWEMMAIQQLIAGVAVDSNISTAISTHEGLPDPHTVYHVLAGRAGGQYDTGGTAAGENLTLRSTTHATKGKVFVGSNIAFTEAPAALGIGTTSPGASLEAAGAGIFGTFVTVPTLQGSTASGGDLTIRSTSHATKGNVNFGTASTYDELNTYLGIGTVTPETTLDILGDASIGYDEVTELWWGPNYMFMQTDDNSEELQIGSASAGGVVAGGAGLYFEGPSHATRPGYLGLYGTGQINFGLTSSSVFNDPILEIDSTSSIFHGPVASTRPFISGAIAETVDTNTECNSVTVLSVDNSVVTLPENIPAADDTGTGCMLTFVNGAASGTALISISPTATDRIAGSCIGSTGQFSTAGAVGKDIRNPKATQQLGDRLTLFGNNSTPAGIWYILDCAGVWELEP